MEYNPAIAHLTAEDGTVFQVLNKAGADWDEAATKAAYDAYEAAKEASADAVDLGKA